MCSGAQPLHFTDGETEVQRGLWLAQDSARPLLADWVDPVRSMGHHPTAEGRLSPAAVPEHGLRGDRAVGSAAELPLTPDVRLGLQRKSGSWPPRGAEGKHTWFTRAPEK